MEHHHSSHHRATGKHVAARSRSAPSRLGGKAVSQGRSVHAWMVEGTEVLISTVALFGKVSANRAVRFVCQHVKIGQFKM